MNKFAALVTIGLAFAPAMVSQESFESRRQFCVETCLHEHLDKARLIAAVQAPDIKYESFTPSNVKVRIYRDTAVATCLWFMRAIFKGQHVSSQMLVMHVYVYGPSGYQVVAGQTTLLPPYPQQPL